MALSGGSGTEFFQAWMSGLVPYWISRRMHMRQGEYLYPEMITFEKFE